MIDVLVVFGTRPEAIKMVPLVNTLQKDSSLKVAVCATAQHRDMLDQVLALFDITPEYDFNLMTPGQDLFDITCGVMKKMRDLLQQLNPKIVIVHGDTTTSMATSISCFYLNIPVAHVEAGLRTFDLTAPFPEEFNRRLNGLLATLHFAPTEKSAQNLIREGVPKEKIYVTGNTVIDSLQWATNKLKENKIIRKAIDEQISKKVNFELANCKFVLITGHRRENFGHGFNEICEAISTLASKFSNWHFVYPVHLNPNVRTPVNKILMGKHNVHLIDPLEYMQFIRMLDLSAIVLTDSGGIQEEAPSLGKPVLVMRNVTERPEAVLAGTVKLVGSSKSKIVAGVAQLIENDEVYLKMSKAHNPYGDGRACNRIINHLKGFLNV
jgi:UDP-N-acetylglucosamine 2-epimerase (non-hydrolysing)